MSRKIQLQRKIDDKEKTIVKAKDGKKTFELKDYDDKNLTLPKKYFKKHLAIILKENSGCVFKWTPKNLYRFSVDENTYFNTKSSNYVSDNNILVSVYLEGIPIAISHDIVEWETVTKTIHLLDGTEQNVEFEKIKGVNVDSQIIDYLLNRGLSDVFTYQKASFGSFIQTIMLIILIIINIVSLFGLIK